MHNPMKTQPVKQHKVRVRDSARTRNSTVVKTVKVSPISERILQDVTRRRAEALRILADR